MISIIDYNAGNIRSVFNAVKGLGFNCQITSNKDDILKSDGVIFPGQGRAGQAMNELTKNGLDKIIMKLKTPFLGICLGMQLLLEYSEEDNTKCLGIILGKVRKFPGNVITPQIGWNQIEFTKLDCKIKVKDNSYFYFVHSYYAETDEKYIVAKTNYGFEYPSFIKKDNFFATQFHPEKSGEIGLKLLKKFCKLCK